jgi:branched-chain amino acid transport system substrate-binding protein
VPSLSLLPAPAGGQSVRIGFIGPLSGAAAPYGTSCRKGIELALADAMSADTGGSPYRFELAAEDDAGDEVLAGNAAVKLVSDPQVSVVLGSVNSPSTHVAAKVTMLSGVPQITSVSTDPALTRLNNRWFFRNLADDAVQGAALARYFFDARGLRRIALVHDDNRYGKGGARIVEAEATRRGTPVVLLRQFARGTTDFTALADAIAASRPDGLIVWGLFGEAALICKAVAAKGLKLPIAGGDGLVSPSFVQEAGAAAEGVVVTYPFDPARNEPLTRSFVERFQAAYGHEPDSFAAHSYDAAFTVAAAIKQVGPERARVREALASLRSGNGVAGPGGFDVFGNATTPVQLAVIENGKFRLLGAAEVAAGGR